MVFYKAEISDILRCNQRDTDFINELQEYITDILKLIAGNKYNSFRKLVPLCTNAWYYLLTSVGSLQTLGEEYTGIIRVTNDNELISQFNQVVWLILYVSGDRVFDKLLSYMAKKINSNRELTANARHTIINLIDFIKENQYVILRVHQSIFYIFGTYHSLANRLTGIKYVLLRQWMQDATATKSFNVLGLTSLVYLLYLLSEKAVEHSKSKHNNVAMNAYERPKNICILCMDNCKDISCTPCGHLFCWECIHDSLQHQPSCPVCREDIPKASRVIPLQNY